MTSTPAAELPIVLCVDDEPSVLDGLAVNLRKQARVMTATSGRRALDVLSCTPDTAAIISDMRMPGMNGAEFLAQARLAVPDATRILLTGQADTDAAIAAVNEGQVFRFLTKPCPRSTLQQAVEAALHHHRLVTSERVLLEQTLTGAVKALMDVLALADPQGFGRATRIRSLSRELSVHIGLYELWSIEMAAVLSQLGCVALPPEVADKINRGARLNDTEQSMIDRMPAVALGILDGLPRLEAVLGMLERLSRDRTDQPAALATDVRATGGEIIRLAADYELLNARGVTTSLALRTIGHRGDRYEPRLVRALVALRGVNDDLDGADVVAVGLRDLRIGQCIAADVKLPTGVTLVARGFRVTSGFLEKLANLRANGTALPSTVDVSVDLG